MPLSRGPRGKGCTFIALLLFASSAAAQNSGLLLGVNSDSTYYTLWIAPVNGRVVVASRRAGIIVPRTDGFWRLDVQRTCMIQTGYSEPQPEQEGVARFINRTEQLSKERLGQPATRSVFSYDRWEPAAATGGSCASVRRAFRRLAGHAAGEDDQCNLAGVRITYAAPEHLAIYTSGQQTEFCNPGKYRWGTGRNMLNYDGVADSIRQFFSPARTAAITAKWHAAASVDCIVSDDPNNDWGIERAEGAWQAVFKTSDDFLCRDTEEYGLTEPLPASVVDLSTIRAAVPKATDWFISPARDFIAVRVSNELRVYTPYAGALGAPVLTLPFASDNSIVLAEWATGRNVARWTRELSAAR